MAGGWLLLHRKLRDNPLWQEKPFTRGQAWVDLLIAASHKNHSFWVRGIEVKVGCGQVAMSEITMAQNWGWSRGKVRRFLFYLENERQIVQQKSKLTTLITIENWYEYQGNSTTGNTLDGQQTDNRRTTDGTQSKNLKNLKKVKEEEQYPVWLDRDLLKQFKEMRVRIRKPMTDKAVSLMISKLEKLRDEGQDVEAVIEQSILNSWAGVFPVKVDSQRTKSGPVTFEEKKSQNRKDAMIEFMERTNGQKGQCPIRITDG